MLRLILSGCLLLLAAPLSASDDFWLDTDESTDQVNDGALRFLESPPEKPVHHHFNAIKVTEQSLMSGWVELRQCHFNLDPVHELEIQYRPEGIRSLQIISSDRVGSARVKGPTVQLSDIQRGGQICIQAESQALQPADGGYLLQNGPYMRRFLDGYYPMRITVELATPESVRVWKVHPDNADGLSVKASDTGTRISGWFEGILYTRIWMCRRGDPDCPHESP